MHYKSVVPYYHFAQNNMVDNGAKSLNYEYFYISNTSAFLFFREHLEKYSTFQTHQIL